MNHCLIRLLLTTAGVMCAGLAHSVPLAFEEHDVGGVAGSSTDPVAVSAFSAGEYDTSGSVATGAFGSMVTMTANTTYANIVTRTGFTEDVVLTNMGAVPVVIPAGVIGPSSISLAGINMKLTGGFLNVGLGITDRNARVSSSLLVKAPGVQFGTLVGAAVTNQGLDLQLDNINNNGAIYSINALDIPALDIDVLIPAITLAPEESVSIFYRLEVFAQSIGGMAIADFSNTAQLSVVLPPGANLVANTTVPLDWVTTAPVPVPSAVWLFLTGLAGLMGWKRRDKHETRPWVLTS